MLYERDNELRQLMQTQERFQEKIDGCPQEKELIYIETYETQHYEKKTTIRYIGDEMTSSAQHHKGNQDVLMRKNKELRDRLNQMRRTLASEQK